MVILGKAMTVFCPRENIRLRLKREKMFPIKPGTISHRCSWLDRLIRSKDCVVEVTHQEDMIIAFVGQACTQVLEELVYD